MSDSEEENNRGKTSFDDKKKSKACRHFAYGLIEKAVENGWEDHETANLIILVAAQMDFNSARLIKCLEKTSTGTPEIMAVLIDNGHEFSARQLISMFLNKAQNIHKYFSLIGAALECQLFDFNDQETLEALIGVVQQQDYNMSDSERYARLLCEHCKSKRKVAKILSLFTTKSHFSLEESASFIHDIVTYDFFFDIPGDIESFYKNLRPANLKERLLILLSASKHLNSKNEIVESDADSEGNLMDFVVGEDDVSMASGSDLGSNESAEEDLLSESDEDGEKSSGKKNKKSKMNQKQAKETKKSKSSGGNSSKGSNKSTTSSAKRKGSIDSSDDEGDGEVSSGDEADTLRSKASGGSKASTNSIGGNSKGGSVVSAKKRKLIIEDDDDEDDEEEEQDSGVAETKTAVSKTAVSKSVATKDTAKTTVVAVAKSVSVTTSNATSNKKSKSKLAVQSSSSSGSDESGSDSSESASSSGSSLSSGAKRNQNYIASGASNTGSGGVGGKQKIKPNANKNNLNAADTVKLYPSDNSTINGSSSSSDESDSESGSESGSEGELRHFDDEAIEGEESSDGDSDGEGRRVTKNGSKSSGNGRSSGSSRHMNMNIDDSESEDDSDDNEDRVEDEY